MAEEGVVTIAVSRATYLAIAQHPGNRAAAVAEEARDVVTAAATTATCQGTAPIQGVKEETVADAAMEVACVTIVTNRVTCRATAQPQEGIVAWEAEERIRVAGVVTTAASQATFHATARHPGKRWAAEEEDPRIVIIVETTDTCQEIVRNRARRFDNGPLIWQTQYKRNFMCSC